MSTLQHTSQLRERATRRLVLFVLIATIVAGGIATGIVAIASGGSGPAKVDSSPVVNAGPIYASGALQRELPAVKAAQSATSHSAQSDTVLTPQTPGPRP